MKQYKFQVILVLCCILLGVFAQVQGTLFMQTLIDSYILPLLDEKPEVNEGDITLVHAKFQADDTLTEINESTGIWAWKKQNADGTVTYTQLKGDIVFKDVDFGYDEGKIVLHDINL